MKWICCVDCRCRYPFSLRLCFFLFSCVGGVDSIKYHNEVELFEAIDPNVSVLGLFFVIAAVDKAGFCDLKKKNVFIPTQESKHKRTDRSVYCCLRKAEPGKSWPRLTKDKAKVGFLFLYCLNEFRIKIICGQGMLNCIFCSLIGSALTSTTGKTGKTIQMKSCPAMTDSQR